MWFCLRHKKPIIVAQRQWILIKGDFGWQIREEIVVLKNRETFYSLAEQFEETVILGN